MSIEPFLVVMLVRKRVLLRPKPTAYSEAGFTLNEFYVVRGSRWMRVDTMIYNNHQQQTMMFIVYLEKISNERTNMVEQVRRQLEKFKEA